MEMRNAVPHAMHSRRLRCRLRRALPGRQLRRAPFGAMVRYGVVERWCLRIVVVGSATFDVRGGRSREAAEGICKRSLQTVPLDRIVRPESATHGTLHQDLLPEWWQQRN